MSTVVELKQNAIQRGDNMDPFRRMGTILLCCFVLLCQMVPMSAAAAPAKAQYSKLIRVGIAAPHNSISPQPSRFMSAYLAEIAKYTDWHYEFVFDSWSRCLQMMDDGRIDLLFPTLWSPQRDQRWLFSKYSCGTQHICLYTQTNNETFYYNSPASLQGARIGLVNEYAADYYLQRYLDRNGIQVTREYYPSEDALLKAFANREISLMLSNSLNAASARKIVVPLAVRDVYFVVTKDNQALMDELNAALEKLQFDRPYFNLDLQKKYFSAATHETMALTEREHVFIQSVPELTVLYYEDYYPFSWKNPDTGACEGAYVDILQLLGRKLGLSFRFVPVADMAEAQQLFREGQGDLLLSAYDGSSNLNRDMPDRLFYTEPYYNPTYMVAGNLNRLSDGHVLSAACQDNDVLLQAYLKEHHPEWKVNFEKMMTSCLQQVMDGQADVVILNSDLVETADYLSDYPALSVYPEMAIRFPAAIGVPGNRSRLLLSILNKGVHSLTPEEIEPIVLRHLAAVPQELTWHRLWRQHSGQIVIGCLAFLIAAVSLGAMFFARRKNRVLDRKNKELGEVLRKLAKTSEARDNYKISAETDALTGLMNKGTLEDCGQMLLEQQASGVLFMIDLDHFKQANDTYGHLYGDWLLREFGEALRDLFRVSDYVGRFGGDEFIVFLNASPVRDVIEQYAQRICEAARMVSERDGKPVIQASVGIAIAPEHGRTYEELLLASDQALYCAKQGGRNRYEIFHGKRAVKTALPEKDS